MSALESLQRDFQRYVLLGASSIHARVEPGPLANREERLAIYGKGYRLRLIEALDTEFGTLKQLLGDERFEALCRAYVNATPSAFRNLRWYGGSLSDYLETTAPWTEQPWLSELARFEWNISLAFDAADDPVVAFGDLAALAPQDWTTLKFRLHGAVQLLELRSNAPAQRKAADAQDALLAPYVGTTATTWLIWRQDFSVHYRSLDIAEAWALRGAREGLSFPEICEGICQWFPGEEVSSHAAVWLRGWVDDGLISIVLVSADAQ